MYNRYIPSGGSYTRVAVEEPGDRERRQEQAAPPSPGPRRPGGHPDGGRGPNRPRPPGQELLDSLAAPLRLLGGGDKGAGLSGLLKALNLDDLDSGDVLLLLIMLFLFLEGDNTELVITLALVLLLSLGDEKKEKESSQAE